MNKYDDTSDSWALYWACHKTVANIALCTGRHMERKAPGRLPTTWRRTV